MTDTHPNQRNLLQELIEYIFSPGSSTRTPTTVAPPPVPTCKRIGCKKPRYSIFDHCSRTCYRVSLMPNAPRCARPACSSRVYIENGTKISKDGMKNLSYDYCSKKCYHKHSAEVSQPTLMFLSSNNYDYNVVQKKVAGQIVINRLARIVYPSQLATRHHAFGINLKIKTSNLKFHGTGLSCSKLSSSGVVCGQAHCKACGIVSNGLCNSCVVRGPGIFVAPAANISHGYTVANALGTRCMFVCSVLEPTSLSNSVTNYTEDSRMLPRFVIFY